MRRRFISILINTDVVIALLLSIFAGILDLVGNPSPNLVTGAIVLTLAALATSLLHNRFSGESIESTLDDTKGMVDEIVRRLPDGPFRELNEQQIRSTLDEARRTADSWVFRGGTGTYTRAVTLPACARRAQADRGYVTMSLEILDPNDMRLCEAYTRLFQSAPEVPVDPTVGDHDMASASGWTADGTRRELYATILAACWYQSRYRNWLKIEIGLSATMTIVRWDLSPSCLLITHRGPGFPGLLVDNSSRYYRILGSELRTSFQQSRKVPIDLGSELSLGDEPTVDEVRELFVAIGLQLPVDYVDDDVTEIVHMALHTDDPYPVQSTR